MSEQQQLMSNNNIPVNEAYWALVEKADNKFSKIRDLPSYDRNRYDTYFYKVFKVYTHLWKFQQENRHKLVEAGVKRWEIGEIASRIAQLYYGQYMRTSDASYLSQSYIFYEAIFTREYFMDALFQDLNLANKQLRFFARFLMVCLVLNRREMVHYLVNQLKLLADDCRRAFQETDFKEWKLVVQEIIRFLKADSAFMNIRPLRYSLVLDPHPDSLPHVATKRNLKLRDAILSTYHHNEVKYSELTLDTFRMLQCLEWEPSGSFYQSSSNKMSHNGGASPARPNYAHDIADPTLPPNPRKAVLYRPSVTQFLAVLGMITEELPPDGVLLIYLSASGRAVNICSSINTTENAGRSFQSDVMCPDGACTPPFSSPSSPKLCFRQSKGECLYFGRTGNGGNSSIYPSDLIPFTRRPLFIVIDSDGSDAFKAISGSEKGEPAAVLLSPSCSVPLHIGESSRYQSGSLFTIFLSTPLQAFCLLLGFSGSDIEMDTYNRAEKLLSSSLDDWGLALATSKNLHRVWAQILGDPFLRRLLLRFLFCRAVLTLYGPSFGKKEFHPDCIPSLPSSLLASQNLVLQMAKIFGATKKFVFSEGTLLPDYKDCDLKSVSS
ncbi:hypothetical protein K2173_026494 [Erythroxylum novogranatense]|uniref:Protein SCAI n=1 Tax=Erythroxylum novogranatense TaxID=1862640 RepID=A0AAV8TWM1_9ROSI|nr:hypothetical protein K2173_026494 [Erythroxylum novogranatense]